MIPVLTLGDPRDLRLFQALRGLLAGKGPLLALGSREVWLPGGKTPFLLGDCGLVSQIWGNGLLAVKNCQLLPSSLYAQEGSLAVICSHHRESVELLARTGIQAVTCGLSPRDTVTFSSLEPGERDGGPPAAPAAAGLLPAGGAGGISGGLPAPVGRLHRPLLRRGGSSPGPGGGWDGAAGGGVKGATGLANFRAEIDSHIPRGQRDTR